MPIIGVPTLAARISRCSRAADDDPAARRRSLRFGRARHIEQDRPLRVFKTGSEAAHKRGIGLRIHRDQHQPVIFAPGQPVPERQQFGALPDAALRRNAKADPHLFPVHQRNFAGPLQDRRIGPDHGGIEPAAPEFLRSLGIAHHHERTSLQGRGETLPPCDCPAALRSGR